MEQPPSSGPEQILRPAPAIEVETEPVTESPPLANPAPKNEVPPKPVQRRPGVPPRPAGPKTGDPKLQLTAEQSAARRIVELEYYIDYEFVKLCSESRARDYRDYVGFCQKLRNRVAARLNMGGDSIEIRVLPLKKKEVEGDRTPAVFIQDGTSPTAFVLSVGEHHFLIPRALGGVLSDSFADLSEFYRPLSITSAKKIRPDNLKRF